MRKGKSQDADPGSLSLERTPHALPIAAALVNFLRAEMSAFLLSSSSRVARGRGSVSWSSSPARRPLSLWRGWVVPPVPSVNPQARMESPSLFWSCIRLPREKEVLLFLQPRFPVLGSAPSPPSSTLHCLRTPTKASLLSIPGRTFGAFGGQNPEDPRNGRCLHRTLVCEAEKDPQRSCGLTAAQPEGQSGT